MIFLFVAAAIIVVLATIAGAAVFSAEKRLKAIRYEFEMPSDPYLTEGTLAELARHAGPER